MKKIPPFILIFLIATTLNIVECSYVNITLECQVLSSASCSSDKDGCGVACNVTKGLNYSIPTEVQGFEINKGVKLEQIKILAIKSFGMTENLPQKIGEKLKNLEKLEVVGSRLKFIKNADFKGMGELKTLNLGANKIVNFPRDTFDNLTKLELLYLYGNQIEYLQPQTLYKLTNLREFHVDMNQIQRIEDNFFRNNLKIEKISLNENQIVYFKENFTKFENLSFVDLRRNSELCTACEIMDEKAREKRFNDCERDKHDDNVKKMKNFEECLKTKISENDEQLKKFNSCANTRDEKYKNISKLFDDCVKGNERPITIDKIKIVNTCIVKRIESENDANMVFETCVNGEVSKNEELGQLATNCSANRTAEADKILKSYNKCMFCKNLGNPENLKMCDLRFVKDYDDDLNMFIDDVKKFFGKK